MTLREHCSFWWTTARGKWTVWLGVLIGSAGQLYVEFPQVVSYLPAWGWLRVVRHYTMVILGFLIVISRLRRWIRWFSQGRPGEAPNG